jgi:hypothetical protein
MFIGATDRHGQVLLAEAAVLSVEAVGQTQTGSPFAGVRSG